MDRQIFIWRDEVMCDHCLQIHLAENISTPLEYEKIVVYLEKMIDIYDFIFTDRNCELGRHKNEDGRWIDDIIFHTIKCTKCGQEFTCSVNTYRGGGSFRKGR